MRFPLHLITLLCVLIATLLLGACQTVRYEYVPPASETGRICLTQCAGIRETCRGNEINRAAMEKASCERQQERQYHECRSRAGGNKDKEKECDKQRTTCYAHEHTTRCEEDYRQCYANCGGRVMRIVED